MHALCSQMSKNTTFLTKLQTESDINFEKKKLLKVILQFFSSDNKFKFDFRSDDFRLLRYKFEHLITQLHDFKKEKIRKVKINHVFVYIQKQRLF